MKVTLLGHASLLIETKDITILTDPVFSEPFADGVRTQCPPREINPDALPPIDFLFVSHHHNDHFDIPSLAILPKRVNTVICANQRHLLNVLSTVGFTQIVPVKDYQTITAGDTQVVFTPSANAVPEHGLLVTDPDGKVWNQVDSIFDLAHLPILKGSDGLPVDLHFANFCPLLPTECMSNGSVSFPTDVYEELFEVVKAVQAKFVVPFAAGQAFTGRSRWINPFFFPVAHQSFVDDVHALATRSRAEVLNPGDVIEIVGHEPRVHHQSRNELIRTTRNDLSAVAFKPTSPVPPLVDENPYDISEATLLDAAHQVFRKIDASIARQANVAQALIHWGAQMDICVPFPNGQTRHWNIDFRSEAPKVREGKIDGNYHVEIAASSLHGMSNGLMWDSVLRGGFRCFHTIYKVRPETITRPKPNGQGRMRHLDLPTPFDAFCVLWNPDIELYFKVQLEQALKNRRMLD